MHENIVITSTMARISIIYFHLFTCIVCENVFQFFVRTCANTNILYNTKTHLFVSYNTNNSI